MRPLLTCSRLNTKDPSDSSTKQWPCESGHCGKDDSGQYAPAAYTVTCVQEDTGREVDMGVCNMCANIYLGKTKTRSVRILKVVRH